MQLCRTRAAFWPPTVDREPLTILRQTPLLLVALSAILSLAAACQVGSETDSTGRNLIGGTPTSVEGVVISYEMQGSTCAGAVVGPRHVLVPGFCAESGSSIYVFVGSTLDISSGGIEVSEILVGPVVETTPQTDIHATLLVTAQDLGVTPLTVSSATPIVGDDLRLLGFTSTDQVRSEGAIDVIMANDATFIAEGVGVLMENGWDGPAVTAQDELIGFAILGAPSGQGVDPVIYATTAGLRDWIAAQVGEQPQPDAGVAADAEVAADAGLEADATVGVDSGTSPSDPDGGCACRKGNRPAPSSPLLLMILGVLVFLGRRRRTD